MIDSKTRKKIIALWRKGESKASIERQLGPTQPTILKVIRKAGLENLHSGTETNINTSELEERIASLEEQLQALTAQKELPLKNESNHQKPYLLPKDVFIINLERNWLYRSNLPLQILRNGVAIWNLPEILGKIYPQKIVNSIVKEINALGGVGKKYEVEIINPFHSDPEIRVHQL